MTTGEWQHVVLTFDGTNLQTGAKIYRNGVESSTYNTYANDQDGGASLDNDASSDLWIGDGSALSTEEFDGLLDDVRIYTRALSANEVANLARGRYASGNSLTSTFTLGANLSLLPRSRLRQYFHKQPYTHGHECSHDAARGEPDAWVRNDHAQWRTRTFRIDDHRWCWNVGHQRLPRFLHRISHRAFRNDDHFGNFTMSGGTLDSNGGTVTLDGSSDQGLRLPGTSSTEDFSTLSINKSAGSVILGSAISGALVQLSAGTLTQGPIIVTAQATTIDGGTLTRGSGNYNSRTLTLSSGTYNSNGQTSLWSGAVLLSGGTYTASTATQTFGSSLTISGGTYTGSTGTADINGNLTLNSGTFTAPSITLLSGNFTNVAGTFTQGSGLFTLDGNAQTLSGAHVLRSHQDRLLRDHALLPCREHGDCHQYADPAGSSQQHPQAAVNHHSNPVEDRSPAHPHLELCRYPRQLEHECYGHRLHQPELHGLRQQHQLDIPSTASTGGTGNNRARQRNAAAAGGGAEVEDRSRQEPAQLLSSLSPTTLLWLPVTPKRSAEHGGSPHSPPRLPAGQGAHP